MIIDKKSHIPAYCQLKEYIIDKISTEQWQKDKPIPSERELCEQSKVSRMTVRQAIGELVNDGLLYKQRGKGTFIARSKIEQKNIMSFSELLIGKGIRPTAEIIDFDMDFRSQEIAKKLGLVADTVFYRIKRLRKADNEPIAIEEVFIPKLYCPEIERFDLCGSLYEILYSQYQYKIKRTNLNIDAVIPSENERKLLQTSAKTPYLKVTGNSISDIGLELFYEESYYRSDKFTYKVSVFDKQDY